MHTVQLNELQDEMKRQRETMEKMAKMLEQFASAKLED